MAGRVRGAGPTRPAGAAPAADSYRSASLDGGAAAHVFPMQRLHLALLATVLVVLPSAIGHPLGGPKTFCETAADTYAHDYDNGIHVAVPGSSKLPPGAKADGSHDCGGPIGKDEHFEYAQRGAYLMACDDPACTPDAWGSGSLLCHDAWADHAPYPTVSAADETPGDLGKPVPFWVGTDSLNNLPQGFIPLHQCGDGEIDVVQACHHVCAVLIPPGLDGAYYVVVDGLVGHVWA